MSRNFRLTISYDGTRYQGWEHQPTTDMTIQGKIENVLLKMENAYLHRDDVETGDRDCSGDFTQVPEVICAGRTDAGVHAEAMIASVRLEAGWSPERICNYLNRYLPEDICVKEVAPAGDRFHARYNACGKTYRYRCYVGESKPIFDRKYVYDLHEEYRSGKSNLACAMRKTNPDIGSKPWVPDMEAMGKAAGILVGEHDFRSFCSNPKMKKSTVRLVDKIDIKKEGDYLSFTYHGSGFLQYMVRILTGTLLEVGYGFRSAESMQDLLDARDRRLAGDTAPAQGLTMVKVDYQ